MQTAKPPVEYLAGASKISLESFEITRLNQAANLRKELREVVEEWIEAEVEARLARWVLENRCTEPQTVVTFPQAIPEVTAIPGSQPPVSLGLGSATVRRPLPPRLSMTTRKRFIATRSPFTRKLSGSGR